MQLRTSTARTGERIGADYFAGDPAELIAGTDPASATQAFLRRLVELRPAWMRDALCAEFDTDAWFPERGRSTRDAMEICGRCRTRIECLEYAIEEQIDHGVWGGMTAPARKAHRRANEARDGKRARHG